jgi:hypothetical protein
VIQAVVSIPGRDSVVRYHWDLQRAALDEPTARDIAVTIEKLCMQAIIVYHGNQGQLPLA